MGRIRVEVLNAGGEPGMARMATDQLRDRGFDVVYFGNAESFGRDSDGGAGPIGPARSCPSSGRCAKGAIGAERAGHEPLP